MFFLQFLDQRNTSNNFDWISVHANEQYTLSINLRRINKVRTFN